MLVVLATGALMLVATADANAATAAQAKGLSVAGKAMPAVAAQPTTTVAKQKATSTAASAQWCPIQRAGYLGYTICGSQILDYRFPTGRVHTFIVGTDHAMWQIVQNPNGTSVGWQSLGGWVQVGVYHRAFYGGYGVGVVTYGMGMVKYCRDFPNGQVVYPFYPC